MGRPSVFTTFVIERIVTDAYKCTNCGHVWIPRKKSNSCPNCYRKFKKGDI